jgi:hypothetical protein
MRVHHFLKNKEKCKTFYLHICPFCVHQLQYYFSEFLCIRELTARSEQSLWLTASNTPSRTGLPCFYWRPAESCDLFCCLEEKVINLWLNYVSMKGRRSFDTMSPSVRILHLHVAISLFLVFLKLYISVLQILKFLYWSIMMFSELMKYWIWMYVCIYLLQLDPSPVAELHRH